MGDRSGLLRTYLDILEDLIRRDLDDPRTTRNALRRHDLTTALEKIPEARAALEACPGGAELALLVNGITLDRLRTEAEAADQRYKAQLKGATAPKKKRRGTVKDHAAIRKQAADLKAANPKLSLASIAERLSVTSRLSDRQIRRILSEK